MSMLSIISTINYSAAAIWLGVSELDMKTESYVIALPNPQSGERGKALATVDLHPIYDAAMFAVAMKHMDKAVTRNSIDAPFVVTLGPRRNFVDTMG